MNKDYNIENDDELKGKTPNLDRLGNKNPFKANEDYFENFADRLQNRIELLEEITEEAPILSNIPKYNPFVVPTGYFDELPTIIQERCIQNRPARTIIEWLMLLIKPRFVFPTLAVIIIAFVTFHYLNTSKIIPVNEVAEVLTIEDQLQNIDESTIIDALSADASIGSETPDDSEQEDIVNYLLDNNVDETNLNNEL